VWKKKKRVGREKKKKESPPTESLLASRISRHTGEIAFTYNIKEEEYGLGMNLKGEAVTFECETARRIGLGGFPGSRQEGRNIRLSPVKEGKAHGSLGLSSVVRPKVLRNGRVRHLTRDSSLP